MRAVKYLSMLLAIIIISCSLPAPAALAYSMSYYITVDLSNNIVTVYSSLDDSVVRQMICSSGREKYESPRGTYYMTEKRREAERTEWYTFEDGYGKYGSRIVGNYLFHSFLFTETDMDKVDWETYAAMGTSASHGCIRLYIEDAMWIAENCMPGTRVTLDYNDTRYEYLKELLYERTYTIDSGETYAEFVCMASDDTELGYYSKGEEVVELQERMIELGLYSGEADGFYNEHMVRAVKTIQTVLGLPVTGVVDQTLLAILNSDDAPSSTISTLSEGMSGPAVRSLQQTLSALGLFTGEFDGEYDDETIEAVMQFQRALGYDPTGIASAALQQDMIDSFTYLEQTYGETGYALIYEEESAETGVINASKKLNVRAKKSTDSSIVARLEPGTEVQIVERDDGWARIICGDTEGYVRESYLDITSATVLVPRYIAADAQNPALPEPVYGTNVIRTASAAYGTVSTEDRLLIREAADTDAELVFMLSPGNVCRVISTNDGWAYVSYGGKSGFTQLRYLDITETAELTSAFIGEAQRVSIAADNAAEMALVTYEEGARIMSAASETAEIVAELELYERAEVVFESTSWTQIRIGETTGYISNALIMIGTASELDAYIEEATAPEIVYYTVNTGSDAALNLRDIPSPAGAVLCELENGAVIAVSQIDGEWAQVQYDDYSGYVMSQYIAPVE